MKNQNKVDVVGYTYGSVREGLPPVNNSGSFSINSFRLNSSTNTSQNSGDHKRGTSVSYNLTRRVPFNGSYNYVNSAQRLTSWGKGALYFVNPETTIGGATKSNAYNEAVAKLYERCRGNLDLSVDCFQLAQTKRMVTSKVLHFANVVKAFRMKTLLAYSRNRWKKRPPWDKFLSDSWLEYIYGWAPLVQSIWEIAGQAANIGKDGPSTQLFTAGSKVELTNTRQETTNFAGQNHNVAITSTEKYNVKLYLILRLDPSSKAKMVSTYTSMNPASIAWELIPYSFVVDWFYDIGSYLRACESAVLYGSLLDSFWFSELSVVDTQMIGLSAPRPFSGALSGSATAQYVSFGRSRVDMMPFPTKPAVGSGLDLFDTRFTSAVALIAQLLSPKK